MAVVTDAAYHHAAQCVNCRSRISTPPATTNKTRDCIERHTDFLAGIERDAHTIPATPPVQHAV